MLTAIPVREKQKSRMLCDAFIAGAPKGASGFVLYGVKDSNFGEWRAAKASGKDWYWIDGSYFDKTRNQRFRITKNRYQSRGTAPSTGARFAALGYTVQPMRSPSLGGHTLVVEQSDVFMRLTACAPGWLASEMHQIEGPVRVRRWASDKEKLASTLAQDLVDAKLVVTHSSAAAIEALIAGIPVQVSTMSAAFGVFNPLPRQHVLNALADEEFSIEEMRSGYAWKHLNP